MAYIVGFETKAQRLHFESLWQHLVQRSYPNQTATPIQVLQVGELAISKYHEKYNVAEDNKKLRLVQILSVK